MIKPSASFRPISVDKQSVRKLLVLACYSSLKWQTVTANRHIKDEATDYQLEDDGNDERVLAQPGIGASHGEPLADDSDAQDKENIEANDSDGLLPHTLEARFERQIQVQEW